MQKIQKARQIQKIQKALQIQKILTSEIGSCKEYKKNIAEI